MNKVTQVKSLCQYYFPVQKAPPVAPIYSFTH